MLLKGKVAIVTGSAVGIGRGIAIALAERGADIACLDIDKTNNEETAELVRAMDQECLTIDCDVADKHQVQAAVNLTLQHFDRIDVLINNAAVWDDSSLLGGTFETQTEAYEGAMGACAMGAYYCARACVAAMVETGGGNIVNIITEHIKQGHYLTGQPALGYDCAKFSMWRQVETWAVELRKSNIRVNGLCFGATDTPLLRGVSPRHADAGMKPGDIGQAVINVLAYGEGGPSGETWLFGPTGTPRSDSLTAIEAIGPGGKSA